MGIERPEDRLATLARGAGPLRRVVASLAGCLVRRRAYEPLGFARLGDYARERLGVSARTLQDHARVDARLAELRRLEASLVSGDLAWSKVRLLARFVSIDDEAHFIALAASSSMRQLERELRAVARGSLEGAATRGGADALNGASDADGSEPSLCVSLRIPIRAAFAWRRTCRVAAQMAGETTTDAGVLEWVTAETVSALGLGPAEREGAAAAAVCGSDSGRFGPAGCRDCARAGVHEAEYVCASEVAVATSLAPSPRPGGRHVFTELVHPPMDSKGEDGRHSQMPGLGIDRAGGAADRPEPAGEECNPCTLPPFLQPLVEGLAVCEPHELDARLRQAVRLEQRLDAELAPLLRAVMSPEHAWRERWQCLAAVATGTLGMSPRKARALLRIERLSDRCPALRAAYRAGALSWVQAQQLVRLVVEGEGDNAGLDRWIAWAQGVSVRKLEETVGRALLWRAADPRGLAPAEDPERIAAARDEEREAGAEGVVEGAGSDAHARQTCAHPTEAAERVRLRIRAHRDVVRLFRGALCSTRLALERATGRVIDASEGFEAMIDHALQVWNVQDPWLRRRLRRSSAARIGHAIFERDGWRCSVPGCTSRRNLHAHHIVFRSAGGSDAPENQTTLCAFHHQSGVHAGHVRIRGRAPDRLVFELGVGEGRAPLVSYRSGDRIRAEAPGPAGPTAATPRGRRAAPSRSASDGYPADR